MKREYASIAFSDPARAKKNLELVEQRLPESLRTPLPYLLTQVPEPDEALNYLEKFLRPQESDEHELPRAVSYLEKYPAALHYLLTVFSYSRFLSETLIQEPELITTLHRPARPGEAGPHAHFGRGIEKTRTAEDLREEFARFETTSFDLGPAVALARFKRREYLRIMLRDVLGLATLAETTLELSILADLLLSRALRLADQQMVDKYGTPQTVGPDGRRQAVELVILSLGKLGGQELNYGSDIDLMFLYASEGETSGGSAGAIQNAEFFVRVAQAVLKLITENTPEGAVFRADLRLRPQGSEGDLAVSLPAALNYYRTRAREWELQMLIKARCSAGDRETARVFLREVQPLIYRTEVHVPVVEAVLNARQEMTKSLVQAETRRLTTLAERARKGAVTAAATETATTWNVKLSPGGIRDIEFLTQCLQRLYGGADAWLRVAPTMVALQRLHDKGHLSGRDFYRLASAYQFLRKVEHRMQLREGLQRHTLPESEAALDRLARRSGMESAGARPPREILLDTLRNHIERVRGIYERLLAPGLAEDAAARAAEPEAADASTTPLLRRLESEYPIVAAEVAQFGDERAAEEAGAGYARRGLSRYLNSAVHAPATMAALEAHPEWIRAAAELFERSDLAVDLLCRHAEEIRIVADAAIRGVEPGETPRTDGAAALRVKARREILATVVRALLDAPGAEARRLPLPFVTFGRLTRIAEEALSGALELAAREILGESAGSLAAAPLAVVALGRLGTVEMDIGSDADLLFLADDAATSEERESWRRVAERFVHIVSSHTRDGVLYPIDTRLRPRGGEGELLPALGALETYFRNEAAAWEAVTFLKSRPVAGNLRLGARLVETAQWILSARFSDAAVLARELARTRERVEKDVAAPHAKGKFKKSRGGYYDLEYAVGYLSLVHDVKPAASDWPMRGRGNALEQICGLREARAVDAERFALLHRAAILYRSVDHATRLITGRAIGQAPEPALEERIARLLRQWEVDTRKELRGRIESTRGEMRALYEEIVVRRT
jgi:glutamate-ammonia-ligase adenylyltransferase